MMLGGGRLAAEGKKWPGEFFRVEWRVGEVSWGLEDGVEEARRCE